MAKPLPPKLGGQQPKPPTGATREPDLSSPSKPAAQPPPDPRVQKKKLKDIDWTQKGYFDGDGLQGSEKVSEPPGQAPRRGRTLVIPALKEQPESSPQPEAESAHGAWAEAAAPSAGDPRVMVETRELRDNREPKDAREAREARNAQQQPRPGDARGAAQKRSLGSSPMQRVQPPSVQPPPLPGQAQPKGTLYEMLENAKEPGVLYTEEDGGGGSGGEQEDPELLEAVEECIRLLFGVRGIHHISPGKNDQGEKVVVVAAGPGFNEESMRRVPERVRSFKTLVALPFDLLPLKRAAR